MVPQPFAARENWLYLEFWAVISDPWYPGYWTLTVAPEPLSRGWPESVTHGGQNRYSCVTTITSVGFDGEVVGLMPP
jgi:hypothetical protein